MGRNLDEFIIQNYQKAINLHHIQVFYQPVIRTSSRRLCSFEALARWIDPELGMIYPDEFIPVLERKGLIHHLDTAILRQVCARIRTSFTTGEMPIPVSVNLSRLDFALCDIFSVTDHIVSDYQIPHDFIYFEITESVMAEQKDLLKGIVDRFRSAGYQIWMDDFGSAYSSLNALKEFEFDELKLDMCFLRPFTLRSRQIATAVVEMAKHIDVHTLVEGVETEEQFDYFRNIGCEKVQGYYFGRPMPYEQALMNLSMKGISVEPPQERKYYDDIGRIDYLSAVPFLTQAEQDDLTTARQLNSIPLALAEFSADYFRVLYFNSAFEETANSTGIFHDIFTQEMLNQPLPYHLLSDRIVNLMDSVKSGDQGRMLFTIHEQYYEVQARRMAVTHDRYCVLIRITNLTKDSQSENTGYLDEFSRRIYALFERITLVNLPEDTIRPLYTATREDLVSGRQGIQSLVEEYARKYLYPDDQEAYIQAFRPDAVAARFHASACTSYSEIFRSSIRHGQYAWKEYTMLKIDEERFFMLVRNLQGEMSHRHFGDSSASEKDDPYAPSRLWSALIRSDLLRIFWKDYDRRFLGASKAFLDYYGFKSVDEIIGKNDEDLGWHVHPDRYKNDEYLVIHEGQTFHHMPGLCMSDGENREILASKMPLYNDDGEIRGLMGFFVDKMQLTANDNRGLDSYRKDILTGLLNTRGISEEATAFHDEYILRGKDFVRIHIGINDFTTINEQYGYDFGDRVLSALGGELKRHFGLVSAVGRYSGHKFVVLQQIECREDAHDLRDRIKAIGESIQNIDGAPITLYLSVGFTLFSECQDLEEQAKMCEVRLHADHDSKISSESRIGHASEIFHLFDDLPISYSVYHVTYAEYREQYDAVIFYVNRKYEEYGTLPAKSVIGHSVRELYPFIGEEWFENVRRAAMDGETVEGEVVNPESGKRFRFTARQIIYPGYCAITYQEIERNMS